ncbi:sorting nexin-2-like [Glossina fuscipes fuscipes]
MANQTDKLGEAYQEVEEWQVKVQRCQQQFQEISTEIKKEMDCFELSTVKDFKNSIIRYIEDQMAHQQQVSSSIDSFYIHQ